MADTDATATTVERKRAPRWLKIALIGSLALNVLFFGATAGAWWRGGHGGFNGRGAGNVIGFIASLPAERRSELMQRSRVLREQVRPLRQAAREAARERSAALLAEPFDKQRFIDAQTRQVEADGKLRLLVRDIIAEAASNMSATERQAFINWRDVRRAGPDAADEEMLKKK